MNILIKKFVSDLQKISRRGKLLVGVTGNIGSGKSTFLKFLADFGVYTISSDEIVRKLLTQKYYCGIILARYPNVADSINNINRKALSRLIFSNERAKRFIENLIHPRVVLHIIKELKRTQHRIIAIEIPLLFEIKIEEAFDITVCIVAEKSKVIGRLKERRNMNLSEINLVMKHQLPCYFKIKKADVIIFNNDDIENFKVKTREFFEVLKMFMINKYK